LRSNWTFAKCGASRPELSFYGKRSGNTWGNLLWRSRNARHY
jgi:hypothetical protein